MRVCEKCGKTHDAQTKFCGECIDEAKIRFSKCTKCKKEIDLPKSLSGIYRLIKQDSHLCADCAKEKAKETKTKNAPPRVCARCGKEFISAVKRRVCYECEDAIAGEYSQCVICKEPTNLTIEQAITQALEGKPRLCRSCAAKNRKSKRKKIPVEEIEARRYRELRAYAQEHRTFKVPMDISLCAFMCNRYNIRYGQLDALSASQVNLETWLDELEEKRKPAPAARHGWEVHHHYGA